MGSYTGVAVQNLKIKYQTWTVEILTYQLLLTSQICHWRINLVDRFQLCDVIYSAPIIVIHNLEAMGEGCDIFNINQNLSIYRRDFFKVRVWSTPQKTLNLSQTKRCSPPSFHIQEKFNTMPWSNIEIFKEV